MTIGYDNYHINHQILLDLPFREGDGTITRDEAKPHHQDVNLINTPTWESQVSGLGVIDLDGVDQHLVLASAACADLDFTSGDYSLGVWVLIESGGDDDKTLMSRFLLDNDGWELYHYTNEILTLRHHHAAGATLRTAAYSENWAYDKWWFMGFSRQGASAQFYRGDVDGLATISTTISAGGLIDPEACNQNLYIGCNTGAAINFFKGKIWRPRAWGRALSAEDWKLIFESERHWFEG